MKVECVSGREGWRRAWEWRLIFLIFGEIIERVLLNNYVIYLDFFLGSNRFFIFIYFKNFG